MNTRTPVFAYPHLSSFSAAIAQAGRPMPAKGGSFLTLEASNLQIVTLKEAEDGEGFILRFREVGGQKGEAKLSGLLGFQSAWLCNGVEEKLSKLTVTPEGISVPYKPNAFTTVRFLAKPVVAKVAAK